MRFLAGLLFSLVIAAAVGLGATFFALNRGLAFGEVTIGAWSAWPKTGTTDIDPYARAVIARSGELPIGSGDGVAFFARTDDQKRPLDGRCDVVITGNTPQARYWTLTLYDRAGHLVGNAANRYGFTSQEAVRKSDGSFTIVVAPRTRPGNWIPSGAVERYVLVLRLYDTPFAVATQAGREVTMPAIEVQSCPS